MKIEKKWSSDWADSLFLPIHPVSSRFCLIDRIQSGYLSYVPGSSRPSHIHCIPLGAFISTATHAVIRFKVPYDRFDLHALLERLFKKKQKIDYTENYYDNSAVSKKEGQWNIAPDNAEIELGRITDEQFLERIKQREIQQFKKIIDQTVAKANDEMNNIALLMDKNFNRVFENYYNKIMDLYTDILNGKDRFQNYYEKISEIAKSINDKAERMDKIESKIMTQEEFYNIVYNIKSTITNNKKYLDDQLDTINKNISKKLSNLHEEINNLEKEELSSRIEWLSELEKFSDDHEAIEKIKKIVDVLEVLPKDNKRFPSIFRTLSYELGIIFFQIILISNETEADISSLIGSINNWLEKNQFKYEYIVPKLNDSYDPDLHQPIDGKDPDQRNEIAKVSAVLCWGIRDKIKGSTFVRAEVKFDRSSRN